MIIKGPRRAGPVTYEGLFVVPTGGCHHDPRLVLLSGHVLHYLRPVGLNHLTYSARPSSRISTLVQ